MTKRRKTPKKEKKKKDDQITKEKVSKRKTKKSSINPKNKFEESKEQGRGIIQYFDQKSSEMGGQNSIQIYRNMCCTFPNSFSNIKRKINPAQSYKYYQLIKDQKWLIF